MLPWSGDVISMPMTISHTEDAMLHFVKVKSNVEPFVWEIVPLKHRKVELN